MQIPQDETKESTSEIGFNVIIKEASADLAEIIEMVREFFFSHFSSILRNNEIESLQFP